MKYVFGFILLFHGIIHLIGFVKAFRLAEIDQLTQSISKPIGVLWLVVSILFIISALLFLFKKEWWFLFAIVSVVLSQILIMMYWTDAKFGTVVNLIILLVGISAFGNHQFNYMVQKESSELLKNIKVEEAHVISEKDIFQLPEIVQKWMRNSGVIGKERIVSVRLKQEGEMKTKPENKWMPFRAEQYFDVDNSAFVWATEVDFLPMVKMSGRDKFTRGKGEMLIKLAALIPVVDEGNNEKINTAAMIRYMAEMVWFPSAALNADIKWKPIGVNSVQATFTCYGKMVSGIFKFSDNGEMQSFEAKRYYGAGKDATLETWLVKAETYKEFNFNGFKIPNKCSVTWKLKEGDFNWLNLEITDLEYNTNELYAYNNL